MGENLSSDKGLISRIHKEIQKFNIKRGNAVIKWSQQFSKDKVELTNT
jgi:hypothetical protein